MAGETGWFRGEGGVVFEMDLPLPEAIAQRVRRGAIVRVAGAGGGRYVAPDSDTGDSDTSPLAPPTSRPPQSAPKADWVAWAVVQEADPEAAAGMSKGDLIDRYGREGD